jgi:hypothetical protein
MVARIGRKAGEESRYLYDPLHPALEFWDGFFPSLLSCWLHRVLQQLCRLPQPLQVSRHIPNPHRLGGHYRSGCYRGQLQHEPLCKAGAHEGSKVTAKCSWDERWRYGGCLRQEHGQSLHATPWRSHSRVCQNFLANSISHVATGNRAAAKRTADESRSLLGNLHP